MLPNYTTGRYSILKEQNEDRQLFTGGLTVIQNTKGVCIMIYPNNHHERTNEAMGYYG